MSAGSFGGPHPGRSPANAQTGSSSERKTNDLSRKQPTQDRWGAVLARTGKKWEEWFAVLDRAGASARSHPEIVRLIRKKNAVSDGWCQMVTVEYERARGLRAVNQTAGGFVANVARTLEASAQALLYGAWFDAATRRRWPRKAGLVNTPPVPDFAWRNGLSALAEVLPWTSRQVVKQGRGH